MPPNFHDFLNGYPNGPSGPKHRQPTGWAGAGEPVYILGENGKMYETRPTNSVLRSLQPCAYPISNTAADCVSSPEHSHAGAPRRRVQPANDASTVPYLRPASSSSLSDCPRTGDTKADSGRRPTSSPSTYDDTPMLTPNPPSDPRFCPVDNAPPQVDSARRRLDTDVVEEFLVEHRKLPKHERFDISSPRTNATTGPRAEPSRVPPRARSIVDVGAGVGRFEHTKAFRSTTDSGVHRSPNASRLLEHRNSHRTPHCQDERVVATNKQWSIRWDDDAASASRSTMDTRKPAISTRKTWEPVTKLTEMGFDEVVARNALQAAAGDVQKAIRYASSEQVGPLASWTWESEHGVYIPFDPHVNKLLHQADNKKLRVCTYKIQGVSYTANLERRLQKNNTSNTVRRIRPPEAL
eukprot:GEMP01020632.1.p1 GENE.GEMP01020632.1~~GEMP01020632.1.p1  ORF type:complete len:409 (+),score=59.30 GEMP01020632.1:67-1293(+)